MKNTKKTTKTTDKFLEKEIMKYYTDKHWLVNPYDVISYDSKGGIRINNQPITELEIRDLKQEVASLEQFRIWQILQETIKQKAIEKAVLQSENYDQVLSGKLMIHNLGIIKSIIELIKAI